MAAELDQRPQILDILDPLGANREPEAVRQLDGGGADRLLGAVGGAAYHAAAIELELDAGQVAHPRQRGTGTAEIVDRQDDVVELQLAGDLTDAARIEQHVALGDLD